MSLRLMLYWHFLVLSVDAIQPIEPHLDIV